MSVVALPGKGEWLFLDGDFNSTIQQMQGNRLISSGDLEIWRAEVRYRKTILANHGVQSIFLVAPNKESVYEDCLPESVVPSINRPIKQLTAVLDEEKLDYIFPIEELLRARAHRDTYPTIDTHWNDYGALLATNCILSRLGLHQIKPVDCTFWEENWRGDLGSRRDPVQFGNYTRGKPACDNQPNLVYDNKLVHGGRCVYYQNPGRASRVMVFGDSFSENVVPWLASQFGKVLFVHTTGIDQALIRRFKADIVIWQYVERFLIIPPMSAASFAIGDVIDSKISALSIEKLIDFMENAGSPRSCSDTFHRYLSALVMSSSYRRLCTEPESSH